jgi:amino acid transporter
VVLTTGAIGTGLFLSLGGSIATGGPLGSLLGYTFIGLIVCAVQFALGEVSALLPVTGSFVRHAETLSDPALGFALGWTIVYGTWLSIPSEISAICVLFAYWSDVNASAWIMTFIVLTALVAYSKIRYFGEIEFVSAILKILLIVGIILLGLITALGGVRGVERVGFRYWRDPGPFVPYIAEGSWGRFLGFWSVLINAVFSFSGIESIAMAAAEVKNPRAVIPKACKRVFARVALFYVLAVLVVGMIVPSNDPRLAEDSGTAATSPFVLATAAAGVKAIPHIVNAVVITSAWSSGNQALLSGSRVLYSLALKGQAPRFFLRTTRWGTPWACATTYVLSSFLAFMALSSSAITVFYWFVSLVGCGVLISWSCVLVNHIRLRMAFRVQGVDPHRLPWYNSWTRENARVPANPSVLVRRRALLLPPHPPDERIRRVHQGQLVRLGLHHSLPVSAPLTSGNADIRDIGLVAAVFLGWKLIKKTRWVSLSEIPLEEILSAIEALPEEKEERSRGAVRFISWLWD